MYDDDGIDNLFAEIGHEFPCENPFPEDSPAIRMVNGRPFTVTVLDTVYRPTRVKIGYKRSQNAWSGRTDLSRHHYPSAS
jgi:hypothetical protein